MRQKKVPVNLDMHSQSCILRDMDKQQRIDATAKQMATYAAAIAALDEAGLLRYPGSTHLTRTARWISDQHRACRVHIMALEKGIET